MSLPARAAPPRADRDAELAACLAVVAESSAASAAAFEAFYDATVAYARALASRMLAGPDLEDLLADAYFEAWRGAARFDPARGSAVTWLLTIVRSRAIDLLRRQATGSVSTGLDDIEFADEQAESAADRLWRAEAGSRLHAALASLKAEERWVLGLAYFKDLSHAQIAAITGLPLGSVKSLILRAQHKLRDRLDLEPRV
jgi:RNA polymerase sigma-70 factor (ECF subfamily)